MNIEYRTCRRRYHLRLKWAITVLAIVVVGFSIGIALAVQYAPLVKAVPR